MKSFLAWGHGGVLRQVPHQQEAVARVGKEGGREGGREGGIFLALGQGGLLRGGDEKGRKGGKKGLGKRIYNKAS